MRGGHMMSGPGMSGHGAMHGTGGGPQGMGGQGGMMMGGKDAQHCMKGQRMHGQGMKGARPDQASPKPDAERPPG